MKITLTDSRTSVLFQPRNFTVNLSGARGPAGQGLPAGGAEGQIIVKQSATDYDTAWADNYATNVELYVKNSTASPMTKGQVVYVSGADGNNPTVSLAIATSEAGSSKTIGVLKQGLAVGASGYVITDGLLEGLNTNSAGAAGDTIWLSPTTAGGVVYGTANKPSAPNHMVFIGYVLRKNTNNGKIFVKIQNGFELQELHNVAISNPVTGQVLKYNATTQLWSNDTDAGGINTLNGLTASTQTFATGTTGTDFGIVSATGTHTFNIPTASASARGLLSSTDWSTFNGKQGALTLTTAGSSGAATLVGATLNIPQYQSALTNPVTGTGTSGQVSYWSGTGTQTGSVDFTWDNTNKILLLSNSINSNTERGFVNRITTADGASPLIRLQKSRAGVVTSGTSLGALNGEGFDGTNYIVSSRVLFGAEGTISTGIVPGNITLATANSSGVLIGRMTIASTGNVSIGTNFTNSRFNVVGAGTTSATTALLVQNGTPSSLFSITDNGQVNYTPTTLTGSEATSAIDIQQTWNTTGTPSLIKANITDSASNANSLLMDLRVGNVTQLTVRKDGTIYFGFTLAGIGVTSGQLNLRSNLTGTTSGNDFIFSSGQGPRQNTTGTHDVINIRNGAAQGITPTSGTAVFNIIHIPTTINQTGGANGITRGLYVNPTLTAAADWRSLEWSNNTGWGLYGAGTANNYLAGSLGIGETTLTGFNLRVNKNISGSVTSIGISSTGNIQSGVTIARYNQSIISNSATSTTTTAIAYFAGQGTISGTITNAYGFFVESSLIGATNDYGFYGDIAADTGRWNLYMSGTAANYLAGDTAIGTTTTSGGRLTVRGSGTTSATIALLVQNSNASQLLTILNNGYTRYGNASNDAFRVYPSSVAGAGDVDLSGQFLTLNSRSSTNETGAAGGFVHINGVTASATSGIQNILALQKSFAPTSGTAAYTNLVIASTINQTGGANGITRGLYVNPTLTAAADWRGIESVAASNANHTLLKLRNATVDVFTVKADSKIGFWNATPIVQPTTAIAEATFVENSGGTAVNVDSTFAGYTLQQIAQALKDIGILQ
jgi:hypothetical protein